MSNIKLKPTDKMAKLLNATFADRKLAYRCDCVRMSEYAYSMNVDSDTYAHEDDYNSSTGKFSVLCVSYPAGDYACQRMVTSRTMRSIVRRYNPQTIEEFLSKLCDFVEI